MPREKSLPVERSRRVLRNAAKSSKSSIAMSQPEAKNIDAVVITRKEIDFSGPPLVSLASNSVLGFDGECTSVQNSLTNAISSTTEPLMNLTVSQSSNTSLPFDSLVLSSLADQPVSLPLTSSSQPKFDVYSVMSTTQCMEFPQDFNAITGSKYHEDLVVVDDEVSCKAWMCPDCTFFNEGDVTKCEICGWIMKIFVIDDASPSPPSQLLSMRKSVGVTDNPVKRKQSDCNYDGDIQFHSKKLRFLPSNADEQWACLQCTYINYGKRDNCECCESPAKAPQIGLSSARNVLPSTGYITESYWSCLYCTFHNHPALSICECCLGGRPTASKGNSRVANMPPINPLDTNQPADTVDGNSSAAHQQSATIKNFKGNCANKQLSSLSVVPASGLSSKAKTYCTDAPAVITFSAAKVSSQEINTFFESLLSKDSTRPNQSTTTSVLTSVAITPAGAGSISTLRPAVAPIRPLACSVSTDNFRFSASSSSLPATSVAAAGSACGSTVAANIGTIASAAVGNGPSAIVGKVSSTTVESKSVCHMSAAGFLLRGITTSVLTSVTRTPAGAGSISTMRPAVAPIRPLACSVSTDNSRSSASSSSLPATYVAAAGSLCGSIAAATMETVASAAVGIVPAAIVGEVPSATVKSKSVLPTSAAITTNVLIRVKRTPAGAGSISTMRPAVAPIRPLACSMSIDNSRSSALSSSLPATSAAADVAAAGSFCGSVAAATIGTVASTPVGHGTAAIVGKVSSATVESKSVCPMSAARVGEMSCEGFRSPASATIITNTSAVSASQVPASKTLPSCTSPVVPAPLLQEAVSKEASVGVVPTTKVLIDEPTWSCRRCTFNNHDAVSLCECCLLGRYPEITVAAEENRNYRRLPPTWSLPVPNMPCQKVTLDAADPEYIEVAQNAYRTANQVIKNIIQIQRIENVTLYDLYSVRRTHMLDEENQAADAERLLWHGTAADTVDKICTRGFNRSYCGKNATAFGKGVYFARDFFYSAQQIYSPPDSQKLKRVFQCRVLTGHYALGNPAYIEPPARNKKMAILYDSVVDNVKTPGIFVVFHDAQVYPEYLISFKC